MAIHVVIEPEYTASTWCDKIAQGIITEAKHRKVSCFFQTGEFISSGDDLIALIGNSPAWIQDTVNSMRHTQSAHLVLVSNTPYTLSINSICTDLFQSMLDVLSYLQNDCKKEKIALYGINTASTTDLLKLRGFSQTDHVYYNNSNLRACFEEFYKNIDLYDAVICANDYAAVSLLQNLKSLAPSQIQRLFLVSFSNLHISKRYMPSVTSVALDYYEYGRKTVDLYRILLKNPEISRGTLNIKSKIIPRETTANIPFSGSVCKNEIVNMMNNDFYEDREIKDLIILENLFSITNETDEKILNMLSYGFSYEHIAQELYMSVNGIKYRLNKLLETCQLENRRELLRIYKKLLFDGK